MNTQRKPLVSGLEPLMREDEAAQILGVSRAWLQRARWEGDGPDYVKFDRAVRYELDALRRWIAERRVKRFTFADGI